MQPLTVDIKSSIIKKYVQKTILKQEIKFAKLMVKAQVILMDEYLKLLGDE